MSDLHPESWINLLLTTESAFKFQTYNDYVLDVLTNYHNKTYPECKAKFVVQDNIRNLTKELYHYRISATGRPLITDCLSLETFDQHLNVEAWIDNIHLPDEPYDPANSPNLLERLGPT